MPALDSIPRVKLAHLPTPMEEAPRLGEALGVRRLRVKRDDCTGLALGGNKARKLEYLLAAALQRGADTLLTTGGVQSNHARMTAAAACRLGLRCILFLSNPRPPETQGNLLLDEIFGAECRFYPAPDYARIERDMAECAAQMAAAGGRPYVIPVGGSTPLGCLGYVTAVRELAEQAAALGWQPSAMVAAVGSCGTLAGLALGRAMFLPDCRLLGISVARPAAAASALGAEIANEAAAFLGVEHRLRAEDAPVYDDWLGPGYGIATEEGNAAVRLAARTAGLILDPIYTGKALAGLKGLMERGEIGTEEEVLFWHTGGGPALFARPEVIGSDAEPGPAAGESSGR
jgi:L-cysteate sulfo-lyase